MCDGIAFRSVNDGDLGTLYQTITRELDWDIRETIGTDLSYPQFIRQTVDDLDFERDLFLGAYARDTIVGHAMGVRRTWRNGDKGHLKWIFVAGQVRRQGVGTALHQELEKRMRACGASSLIYGSSSPVYLFPGVPDSNLPLIGLLEKCGWQRQTDRISICAWLAEAEAYEKSLGHYLAMHDDIALALGTEDDLEDVFEFIRTNFTPSWAQEIDGALKDHSSKAFCNLIRAKVDGQVLGFSVLHATNPFWFGPMGVKEDCRNRGYGRILTLHTLAHARRIGFEELLLPWINGKEEFYGPLIKKKKWYRLYSYTKDL